MEYEKSISIWNTLYNLHWEYIQTEENSTDLLLKKDKLKGKLLILCVAHIKFIYDFNTRMYTRIPINNET